MHKRYKKFNIPNSMKCLQVANFLLESYAIFSKKSSSCRNVSFYKLIEIYSTHKKILKSLLMFCSTLLAFTDKSHLNDDLLMLFFCPALFFIIYLQDGHVDHSVIQPVSLTVLLLPTFSYSFQNALHKNTCMI